MGQEINSLLLRKGFVRNCNMKTKKFYNYNELPLYKMPLYFEREQKDIGYWFNSLKEGRTNTHEIVAFAIPFTSWIDIDFHGQQQKDDFNNDIKNPKQLMKDLENDPFVFIVGRTMSGGIRIIGLVDSYYREYQDDVLLNNLEDDENLLDKQDEVYKINYEVFSKHIEQNHGLIIGSSYFDKCSGKISQPSFPVYPGTMKHKLNCDNLYHTIAIKVVKPVINVTPTQLLETSRNNSDLTIQLWNAKPATLSNIFQSHDEKLEAIVKFCDQNARAAWYNMYCMYYKPEGSFAPYLVDFETFEKRLESSKSLKFCGNLENYLRKNKVIK